MGGWTGAVGGMRVRFLLNESDRLRVTSSALGYPSFVELLSPTLALSIPHASPKSRQGRGCNGTPTPLWSRPRAIIKYRTYAALTLPSAFQAVGPLPLAPGRISRLNASIRCGMLDHNACTSLNAHLEHCLCQPFANILWSSCSFIAPCSEIKV